MIGRRAKMFLLCGTSLGKSTVPTVARVKIHPSPRADMAALSMSPPLRFPSLRGFSTKSVARSGGVAAASVRPLDGGGDA